jgi:hypothetical protein
MYLAMPLVVIEVNPVSDLVQVRELINKQLEKNNSNAAENELLTSLSPDWCFVDCESYLSQITASETDIRL